MKWKLLLFCIINLKTSFSQTIIHRDPEIEQMVSEVSRDSLRSYINQLVSFGTRHTLNALHRNDKGIDAARNWVLRKFNSFAAISHGRLSAIIDTTTIQADEKRVNKTVILGNVVATLKGADPNDSRIFLMTAHLDNRRSDVMDAIKEAPGANDDGSGVAAVLECARIMSSHNFPATIIFATVSGEEQGLLGSAYMSEKAVKENWDLSAVLNNDIMGSNTSSETHIVDNTKVRVFSEGLPAFELDKNAGRIRALGLENDGASRQLARYMKEIGERYVDNLNVVLVYRNDRFLRGGDHTSFVRNGFAAVRITEMNENYEHQHQDVRTEDSIRYGDLPEFMDFEYLKKNTMLNLANLANLAKAPSPPTSVGIEVKKLTNNTHLSWNAPEHGTADGYYILIRETTSPVWEKKIFIRYKQITLPYSKDNYFFAVQSASKNGNESLPVVPAPQ